MEVPLNVGSCEWTVVKSRRAGVRMLSSGTCALKKNKYNVQGHDYITYQQAPVQQMLSKGVVAVLRTVNYAITNIALATTLKLQGICVLFLFHAVCRTPERSRNSKHLFSTKWRSQDPLSHHTQFGSNRFRDPVKNRWK